VSGFSRTFAAPVFHRHHSAMPSDTLSLVNPFTALGAIAGPAILTNACSILALGTSNRLARVLDRTRAISRHIGRSSSEDRGQTAASNI
jgi:hypothetical protein